MVQQLRVCPLRFSIALLFAFRTALTVPQYSTQTSQGLGRSFEKLRCKKMQFPMFADCCVGFGLVLGGIQQALHSPQPAAVSGPAHGPKDSPEDVPWLSRGMAGEREGTLPLLCPILHLLSAGLTFGRCQKRHCPWLVQLCRARGCRKADAGAGAVLRHGGEQRKGWGSQLGWL